MPSHQLCLSLLNGKTLLVEKGTAVLGQQQLALLQGQARVFPAWGTLETPSGGSEYS